MSNKVRSGETVEFTMVQDQSDAFVAANLVTTFNDVGSATDAMNANNAVLTYLSTANAKFTNLFTALNSAVTQFLAVKDTAGLYDQVVQATVAQISNQCGELDTMLGRQAGPADQVAQVMEQLHAVWAAAVQYQQDQLQQGDTIQQWVVAATTDIATLAASIYNGDTTKTSDLLSLNSFPDPVQIVAGTLVNYYPAKARS
jgi:hypothetical protein